MKPMSENLVKHYISMPTIPTDVKNKMSVVKSDNGHIALLNDYGIDWTYEILGEEYIEDGTAYFVTLALYLPGMVRTGVGKNNTDFNREHKFEAINKAIKNACQTMRIGVIVDKGLNTPVNTDNGLTENSKVETPTPVAPPIEPTTPEQPKVNKAGYTEVQMNRVAAFKKNSNIETNEQFMKYVTSWNKDITAKSQLTPSNIDGFLDWLDNIENAIMDM